MNRIQQRCAKASSGSEKLDRTKAEPENNKMEQRLRFRTVFVLGIGHCGSTLLGRIVNMHPDVLCVGELLRLGEALENPDEHCSCGALLRECSFWSPWIHGLPDRIKRNYRKWSPTLLNKIRELEGHELLLDLSKARAYRLSKRWRDADIGYILMLRDPRGIMRSSVARGGDLKGSLKVHRKWMGRFCDFAEKNPSRCLTIYYEDLVSRPEVHIKKVCDFIGLDFLEEMIRPEIGLHHFVSSNYSAYIRNTVGFRLDERWRTELTDQQVHLISNYLKDVPAYGSRYGLAAVN
jgi:hypothetical protein